MEKEEEIENKLTIKELREKCKDYEEKIAVLESQLRKNKSFNTCQIIIFIMPFLILLFIIFNNTTNHSML